MRAGRKRGSVGRRQSRNLAGEITKTRSREERKCRESEEKRAGRDRKDLAFLSFALPVVQGGTYRRETREGLSREGGKKKETPQPRKEVVLFEKTTPRLRIKNFLFEGHGSGGKLSELP